jgi:hypothetical protein
MTDTETQTDPCQSARIPLHCVRLMAEVRDRLAGLEAKIDTMADQWARGREAFGHLSERTTGQETRLRLLEASHRAALDRRRTWTGRAWALVKAALLVVLGYLFKKGSSE